jgi:hypothetical protein
MPNDPTDILLTGDGAVQDLQVVVKARPPTAKLRVMVLLAAAAYEAEEGSVPHGYVERAFRAAVRMAEANAGKPS